MVSKRHLWVAGLTLLTGAIVVFRLYGYDNTTQPSTRYSTEPEVDWSRFAYTQYATDSVYLCNSVMFFEALHQLSSRADRMLMYPTKMLQSEDASSSDARLLLKARNKYNVNLVPIIAQSRPGVDRRLVTRPIK